MREKGSAHDAFADALTAMKVVKRIVEKSISKTEFVLPAPERLLVLFEARKQAAKENRKNGTPTPNKKRKGNFDESHGKKTNRVAGRTLFIHRLPRGVTKEGIESIFEFAKCQILHPEETIQKSVGFEKTMKNTKMFLSTNGTMKHF